MIKRLRWLLPWLLGALTASALFVLLAAIGGLRYENSDDMLLVKAFMGFEGGRSVDFTLYTHTFLAHLLSALSSAVPTVAWFSLYQLSLLWLSATAAVKCCIRLGSWKGLIAGGCYLGVFAAFVCARINYTTTAAFAGAAAVMQLIELNKAETPFQRLSCIFWSAFLLLSAYSLRQIVALPILCYCLLTLVWQGSSRWKAKLTLRPVLSAAAILCGLLLLFAGVREWEISARSQRETLEWQKNRIELFDYSRFEQDASPALAADSGLTEIQIQLMQQWYFWDADITAETMEKLVQAYDADIQENIISKLGDFFKNNPRYLMVVFFLLLSVCWIILCSPENRFSAIAALLAILGGLIMLLYLCWRGRVLYRGLDTVFLPCGALLTGLALHAGTPRKKAAAILLSIGLVLITGADALMTLELLDEKPDWVSQQREADLEHFALKNPDKLIVRTPNLLRDTRLMPDVSSGLPINTAIWGDWYCRMPGWHQQFDRFELDAETFRLADWLSSPLVFATTDQAPSQLLINGIAESAGRDVSFDLLGTEGTLSFFVFK